MRRLFLSRAALAAAAGTALGASTTAALAQAAPKPTRVVVQVSDDDPARWNLVLNNVKNFSRISAPRTSPSRSSPTVLASAC